MRWLLLLGALSGCDAVFGLGEPELPLCVRSDFDPATATRIATSVEMISFTGDRGRALASINGLLVETGRDGSNAMPVEIEPAYSMIAAAAEPNGDYYFVTAAIEPPEIMAISRSNGAWKLERDLLAGTVAGTPTNHQNGQPVRVVVRLSLTTPTFQELERTANGTWARVGERFELKAAIGANLTQDGLALVFDGVDDADQRGVYVASRGSLDDAFGPPELVLAGAHQQPQLFDGCGTLYVIDDDFALTRYGR